MFIVIKIIPPGALFPFETVILQVVLNQLAITPHIQTSIKIIFKKVNIQRKLENLFRK